MGKLALVVCVMTACKTEQTGTNVDAPVGVGADAAKPDAAVDAQMMASMMMGSGGGTLDADGATLVVPAGALATDTPITVTKTTDLGPMGGSPSVMYLLGPEGQTFATPVTFTIHLAAVPGSGETIVWSKLGVTNPVATTDWELRPTTVSGTDVSGTNTHFSHVYGARFLAAFQ